MKLTAITLNGVPIKEEDKVLVWQWFNKLSGKWDNCASEDQANRYANEGCNTRQAYILKSQPILEVSEPEGKEEDIIDNIFSHMIEGANKSSFVQAAKIIDEYVNDCCMDVPKRIGQDILKELYDKGYTITKQP